jgi:hypothetical protein
MSRELAVIFDLARQHVPIVSFDGAVEPPSYDLHSARPRTSHGAAMALLVEAGLAHVETMGDRTFYRFDQAARAALGAE